MALTTENDKPTEQPNATIPDPAETGAEGSTPDETAPDATPPEPPVPEVKEPEKPKKVKAVELSPLEKQEKAAIIYLAKRYLDSADMQDFTHLFPALFEE